MAPGAAAAAVAAAAAAGAAAIGDLFVDVDAFTGPVNEMR